MNHDRLAAYISALAATFSRRGLGRVLTSAGLTSLAGWPLTPRNVAARKKRGKKRKKKNKRKRKQPSQASPPPPPPPPPQPLPPPNPVTRVDAACPGPVTGGFSGGDGNFRLAQTFAALASGRVVSAQLAIFKEAGSAGDYVLRLAPVDGGGVPTNAVLAETAVVNPTVPAGEALVTFTFRTPASVVAGTQYALVLTRPGGDPVFWGEGFGSDCASLHYSSRDQTGPFSLVSSGYFIFTTFVRF